MNIIYYVHCTQSLRFYILQAPAPASDHLAICLLLYVQCTELASLLSVSLSPTQSQVLNCISASHRKGLQRHTLTMYCKARVRSDP